MTSCPEEIVLRILGFWKRVSWRLTLNHGGRLYLTIEMKLTVLTVIDGISAVCKQQTKTRYRLHVQRLFLLQRPGFSCRFLFFPFLFSFSFFPKKEWKQKKTKRLLCKYSDEMFLRTLGRWHAIFRLLTRRGPRTKGSRSSNVCSKCQFSQSLAICSSYRDWPCSSLTDKPSDPQSKVFFFGGGSFFFWQFWQCPRSKERREMYA